MRKQVRGFSLVELMIVVAIISLIAAFGYPSYINSLVKSNRTMVQGDLEAAAASMAAFRSMNFTYNNATLGANGVFRNVSPDSGSAQYDLVFASSGTTTNTSATDFTILARPRAGGRQVGTGTLGIRADGTRCWNKASSTTCTPGDAAQGWQ